MQRTFVFYFVYNVKRSGQFIASILLGHNVWLVVARLNRCYKDLCRSRKFIIVINMGHVQYTLSVHQLK